MFIKKIKFSVQNNIYTIFWKTKITMLWEWFIWEHNNETVLSYTRRPASKLFICSFGQFKYLWSYNIITIFVLSFD